jgi:hypothetical protein
MIAQLHHTIGKSAMSKQNDFSEEYLKQAIQNLKKDVKISSEQVATLTESYTRALEKYQLIKKQIAKAEQQFQNAPCDELSHKLNSLLKITETEIMNSV